MLMPHRKSDPRAVLGFWYLVLVLWFGGFIAVNISILRSQADDSLIEAFVSLWKLPEWGPYFIVNCVLASVCTVMIFIGLVYAATGRGLLLGLTVASLLTDFWKIGLGIDVSSLLKSLSTLALLPLLIHAYIIYRLVKEADFFTGGRGQVLT